LNSQSTGSTRYRAAIALGSNLGDSCAILDGALTALQTSPLIQVEAQSRYYRTAAVGPPQPDYVNACAVLSTTLSPRLLLHTLLDIEAQFGRERRERWGPRTLDLDLLLFEDWIIEETGLTVPHPHLAERAFVLVPLNDIAADWIHPICEQAIAQIISNIDCSGVRLISDHQPHQSLHLRL